MKKLTTGLSVLATSLLGTQISNAVLLSDFDGGGVPYTEGDFGGGAAGILAGGPSGSFYQLLDNEGGERNYISFDSVDDYDGWSETTLTMDLLAAATDTEGLADGFSVVFVDTETHGDTGVVRNTSGTPAATDGVEEAGYLTKSLGFGFQVYTNRIARLSYDNKIVGDEIPFTNFEENVWGSLEINVTRNVVTNLAVVNVTAYAEPGQAGAAQEIITDREVPDLRLEDFRVQISSRTGGESMIVQLDNIDLEVEIPDINDVDGDGLTSAFEDFYGLDDNDNGLNPNNNGVEGDPKNGAAGDSDGDTLSNLEEFNLGTSPISDDTDDDGYKDNVEDKTGTFAGPASTGTDPLIKDTDGDGLKDGAENPALAFVDEDQAGTNPHEKDSDGDDLEDLEEIALGFDPTVPETFNFVPGLLADFDGNGEDFDVAKFRSAPDGVWIPGGPTGNYYELLSNIGDAGNYISFESTQDYSDWRTVNFQMDMLIQNTQADGFAVNFLSTEAHGESGVVRMDGDGVEESGLITNSFGIGFKTFEAVEATVTWNGGPIQGPDPITLPQDAWTSMEINLERDFASKDTLVNVNLYDEPNLGGNVQSIFTDVEITNMDLEDFRVQLAGRTGGAAMNFAFDNVKLIVDGLGGAGLEITSIFQTVEAGDPDTISATITWNSVEGQRYAILASDDLEGGNLDDWDELEDGVVGEEGETSYTETGIPIGTTKRFYVVRIAE